MITFDEDCGIPYSIVVLQNIMFIIGYGVVTGFYITVGLSGNITLLIAFYKQSKNDNAYMYQVFLTISKTLEILFFALFIIGYKWASGAEHEGWNWYRRNYVLMFFAAYIGCPITNAMIVSSVLCAVAMTADRVFAISKPFVYKTINHKRHQIISAVSCFGIGLLTNIYEIKRLEVAKNLDTNGTWDGYYIVKPDEEYLSIPIVQGLGHVRTTVRLIGVVALIGLNITMAINFHKRTKRIGYATGSNQKEIERTAAEKTLLTLTIYQSCLMAVNQIPHCGEYIAIFSWPMFSRCWCLIVAPFVDGCVQITDAIDFFVIITINKGMRSAIYSVLPQYMRSKKREHTKTKQYK